MKKTGRNDPCPCGSGKKFKKCCESKMIAGRFMAAKVDAASSLQIRKTANLTSLFQARLAETPKKPLPPISSAESPSQPLPQSTAAQSEETKIEEAENPKIEIKEEVLIK